MVNKSIIVEMSVKKLDQLNDRRFKRGDIVFFLNGSDVDWGEVVEIYDTQYGLQVYETKDTRLLNGIPISEYTFDGKYHKLPKGWTWNTPLYELSDDASIAFKDMHFPKTVEEIKHYIDMGAFVKPSEQDKNCQVDVEIDKNGYRLVRKYDRRSYLPDSIFNRHDSNFRSIPFYNCFATYNEAADLVSQYKKEIESQGNMTDREWYLYEIRRVAERCDYSESEVELILDMFKDDPKLEKIEVRNSFGQLEWRYEDRKNWQQVVV